MRALDKQTKANAEQHRQAERRVVCGGEQAPADHGEKDHHPRRKRRRACCGFGLTARRWTLLHFTGMRKRGSSVKRAPNQEPMAVAMANSRACRENCGMPVKKAARLQPIASRAPNPAMMPPATACAMRIRLRGRRSLTLFAHSAAAGSRRTCR